MGLDANGSRFLLFSRTLGVSYERAATMGRQAMHLTPQQLGKNLADFSIALTPAEVDGILRENQGYSEAFFHKLGAVELASFDASSYERATCVHDFNCPIDDAHKARFTAVVDSGTLEHVFNVPVALKNCMEMIEIGGHFVGIVPANQFCGHGFFQFSPEVYFRAFSPENGFRVLKMIWYEDWPVTTWYEIPDPALLKRRVNIVSTTRTYIGVVAQRLHQAEIFRTWPQQSDYVSQWGSS